MYQSATTRLKKTEVATHSQNDHEDAKTIEGTLFEALVKAGAVSEDNSDDATKVRVVLCMLSCLKRHVYNSGVPLQSCSHGCRCPRCLQYRFSQTHYPNSVNNQCWNRAGAPYQLLPPSLDTGMGYCENK